MSRTILCVERCLSAVRRVVLSHANVTACLGPVPWLHANAQRTYEAQEITFEACCFSTNRSVPLDLGLYPPIPCLILLSKKQTDSSSQKSQKRWLRETG